VIDFPANGLVEIVFDDLKQNLLLRLKKDVHDWFLDHQIKFKLNLIVGQETAMSSLFDHATIRLFDNKDAALFKLTWI
jgi:hypothetical protein